MSKISKPTILLLLLLIFINLLALVTARTATRYSCTPNGSYSSNSTYSTNLNTLLTSLPSNISNYGFYKSFLTGNQDSPNALALCRPDRTPDQCRDCVRDAARELLVSCRNQRQGVLWLEYCLVRYSNQLISPTHLPNDEGIILLNSQTVSDANRYFREDVARILADLRVEAANGSSEMKAGVGTRPTAEINASTIYSLLQCTPDLTLEDCRKCLADISDRMLRVVDIARGVRMLHPNCIIRYELYPFYNDTRLRELRLLPPLPPPPPDSTGIKKVVMVAVPIIGLFLALAFIFLTRRMRRPTSHEIKQTIEEISTVESLQYELSQVRAATEDFHNSNKLGQGGFGAVYRGRLFNGQEIAVKRLSENSGQGNKEFKNEVLLVARLQHRNLVRLLGFSLEGTERLLVYELVKNASLDQFIFDEVKRSQLDWDTRHKIIGGVARGLLYLHEDSRLRIIHRDLKASNVLLDGDMNPKIADFGMARLFRHDEIQANTTKIVGTYGYMAPEYAMHGEFSIKSDVFSFGVLVLEILSGKRNNVIRLGDNMEDLLTITWENWQRGAAADMIDPLLQNRTSSSLSQMLKCIHIGLLCVQENAANRPTITAVLHMLGASALTFPLPSQPAFYMASRLDPGAALLSAAGAVEGLSQNEMSVTELYAR